MTNSTITNQHNEREDAMLELIVRHNLCIRRIIFEIATLALWWTIGAIVAAIFSAIATTGGKNSDSFASLIGIVGLALVIATIVCIVHIRGHIRKTSERESWIMSDLKEKASTNKKEVS